MSHRGFGGWKWWGEAGVSGGPTPPVTADSALRFGAKLLKATSVLRSSQSFISSLHVRHRREALLTSVLGGKVTSA